MGSVIGEVTPLALGVALSPFPVVPAILLLFTPRAKATAGAFLAGWAAGILVIRRSGRSGVGQRRVPTWSTTPRWVSPRSSPYRRRTRRSPASTLALPLVLRLAVGEGVLTPLGRARTWLETHNATVTALVLALIGVLLLIEGVVGLRA